MPINEGEKTRQLCAWVVIIMRFPISESGALEARDDVAAPAIERRGLLRRAIDVLRVVLGDNVARALHERAVSARHVERREARPHRYCAARIAQEVPQYWSVAVYHYLHKLLAHCPVLRANVSWLFGYSRHRVIFKSKRNEQAFGKFWRFLLRVYRWEIW